MSHLGPELKQLRQSSGITLRRLAGLVGSSAATLSRFENGYENASLVVVEAAFLILGYELEARPCHSSGLTSTYISDSVATFSLVGLRSIFKVSTLSANLTYFHLQLRYDNDNVSFCYGRGPLAKVARDAVYDTAIRHLGDVTVVDSSTEDDVDEYG